MDKITAALERARDTKALIIGNGVVCRTAEMFNKLFAGQNFPLPENFYDNYVGRLAAQKQEKSSLLP